jgi:L-fuculose-phosphate aldolase
VTGRHAASSELQLHVCIYRERAEVHPVVHVHPPTATGFGVTGLDFMDSALPEIIIAEDAERGVHAHACSSY